MPVTDVQLEDMILRVSSDDDCFYEVKIETIIQLAEDYEFKAQEMIAKYRSVFDKLLKINNPSITEEQLHLISPQVMKRLNELFDGVIDYHKSQKCTVKEIEQLLNEAAPNNEINLISGLDLTVMAIKETMNIIVFNSVANAPDATQATSHENILTPPRTQPRTTGGASSARLSAARPLAGTKEFLALADLQQKESSELRKGLMSISKTPNKAESMIQQDESGLSKLFTPSFSSTPTQSMQPLSKEASNFLEAHGFSLQAKDLDKCTSKTKGLERYTPLTLASLHINEAACRALMEDGASVNKQNGVENTPLHMLCHGVLKKDASITVALSLAQLFLDSGGDLSIQNRDHKTKI